MSYYTIHWDGSLSSNDTYYGALADGDEVCTVLTADELVELVRKVEELGLE